MMRLLVVSAFVAFAVADVSHLRGTNVPESQAAILRSDYELNPDGSYSSVVETQNGILSQQTGQQAVVGSEEVNKVQGAFEYLSPEGIPIKVQYVADENGYQPISDSIPPIPAAILRSLEYNAAHPEEEEPAPAAVRTLSSNTLATLLG